MTSAVLMIFAATALIFQLTSCQKVICGTPPTHDCPPPVYPVAGIYTGTYSVTSIPEQGNLYYSFVVFPDGTFLTKGLGSTGDTAYQKGNWTLSADSTFTGNIKTFTTPSVVQTISGHFSNDGKISNAVWHDVYNPFGSGLSGKFSTMQRVN